MKKMFKYLSIFSISSAIAYSGTVYTDYIDYQQFRDFAENKGRFRDIGDTIKIPKRSGSLEIINLPMPDFSSADRLGVSALVSPMYASGVKHNGHVLLKYGANTGHTYGIIDRNNHSKKDFHLTRFNKVVTDVAPTSIDFSFFTGTYNFQQDFELFARIGSGQQFYIENGIKTQLSMAYEYLTGGLFSPSQMNGWNSNDLRVGYPSSSGQMPIYIEGGDSGSPLWGYHKTLKKWIFIGNLSAAAEGYYMRYTIFDKNHYNTTLNEDTLPDIVNENKDSVFIWESINESNVEGTGNPDRGIGYITQGDKKWEYSGLRSDYDINFHDKDDYFDNTQKKEDLNFTKHLTFAGEDGTIKLASSINMGAGMLTFKSNYTVTSDTKDKTWVGAGILVDKDKKVIWEVNGVEGDYLHKIGEGTLVAQGNGDNKGSLNIGDGTVILNQNGGKAFENIDIVSGRGTVQIANQDNANALDTSKIYFGYRGGRLDLNGTNLTFGDIRATDIGARIVNSNENTKTTVTIDSSKFAKESSIFHGQFGDTDKASKMDIELKNDPTTHKNFGIMGGMNIEGDISQDSNTTLILEGEYEVTPGKTVIDMKENGRFYTSKYKFTNLNMSSGSEFQGGVYADITGDIKTTENNRVVLGFTKNESKYMYDLKQDTPEQDAFFDNLSYSWSSFRGITTFFNGDISLQKKSSLIMGYTKMTGNISSDNSTLKLTNSNITGNIDLKNSSVLTANSSTLIGKLTQDSTSTSSGLTNSALIGTIEHQGENQTTFKNSLWSVTGDSNLSTLTLDNSTLIFGSEDDKGRTGIKFHNLETDNLSGNGKVIFRADLSNGTNDKMTITENANNTTLAVVVDNVTGDKGIELGSSINLIDTAQNENVNLVSTSGDKYVDIGSVKGLLDNSGNLKVASVKQLQTNQSEWVSDMTNAALSDFTAKINLIKTQNDLIGDILNEMGSENYRDGVSYTGNFSNRVYRSDKFNQFEQNIINNALSYQTKLFNGENWDNYLGISFIYGMGSNKFKGDYKGELESFTESIFTKLAHRNGYYLTGTIGGTYLKDKINIDKYETFTGTFGLGTGYEKRFGGLKLSSGLDIATYYITGENYALHDPTSLNTFKRTGVETNDEFLLQIQPNVKLGYNYKYKKLDLGVYGKIGYDYNKYILNSAPELKMKDINVPLQTGLIENGFKFETGVEAEIISFKISLGLVYFTGENNTENLFTNVKFRYLF